MYVFLFGDPEMIDPSERDDSLDSQLDSSFFIISFFFTGFSLANSTQRVYSTDIDVSHTYCCTTTKLNTHDVIRRSFMALSPPARFERRAMTAISLR